MGKLLIVVRQEYLNKVRTKAFLLGTFLFPLLLAGISVLPAYFMTLRVAKPAEYRVVDESGVLFDPLQRALRDTTEAGELLYTLVPEDRAGRDSLTLQRDLGALVTDGKIGGFFLIDRDVVEEGQVLYFAENVSDLHRMESLQAAIAFAVREVRVGRSGLPAEEVESIMRRVPFETFKVGQKGEARKDRGVTFLVAYVIGFIFYLSLFIYGVMMLRAALEEKTSRSAEVMVATVRASTLMGGKILGIGLVGLTQLGIWAALLGLFSAGASSFLPTGGTEVISQIGITFPMVLLFLLYFILGFLLYAGFFGAIGAMVNTETEAQQIQTPVTIPIVVAFMLMFLAIRDPSGALVRILSMIPLFSPLLMSVRICVLMPAGWEIALSILLLVFSIWGVIWMAGKIFRVGLLMYGKRPDLPELIKWIRYG